MRHATPLARFKWKLDYEKSVLSETFERREGWARTEDDDWNFFWASAFTVQGIFNPEKGRRLADDQLVNHYPNHFELSRKDFLLKNIKRYAKEMNKRGHSGPMSGPLSSLPRDFIPPSYLLPADYSIFVEEFRRSGSMWIMKPTNGAQGRGIFLVKNLDQVKKWSKMSGGGDGGQGQQQPAAHVISRYIERPLLIGGRKFDLRIYVLVTSFSPLRMYLGNGFARFCSSKYTNHTSEMQNLFVHLTNVSIQKRGESYNKSHGGKWKIKNLRLYLEATRGVDATQKLFDDVDSLITHSAKAVQNVMINDRHCFECYGYDLLIDNDLKPWLIEVNASPSLNATTVSDRMMKSKMMNDVVDIVLSDCFDNVRGSGRKERCQDHGDFIVLYDEEAEVERETSFFKNEGEKPSTRRGKHNNWR